jgi:hypothetical protein
LRASSRSWIAFAESFSGNTQGNAADESRTFQAHPTNACFVS